MTDSKTVCVFCSSSNAIHQDYFEAARELGECLGREKYSLVYGGADIGLMGGSRPLGSPVRRKRNRHHTGSSDAIRNRL